jgi:hypothetical protein
MLCSYVLSPHGLSRTLTRPTSISQVNASKLANAIKDLSLKTPPGDLKCPSDVGTLTVLSFHYADVKNDPNLWFRTSGCRRLTNSRASSYEISQPAFYLTFEALVRSLNFSH